MKMYRDTITGLKTLSRSKEDAFDRIKKYADKSRLLGKNGESLVQFKNMTECEP